MAISTNLIKLLNNLLILILHTYLIIMENILRLNKEQTVRTVEKLNALLANLAIFYQNLRGLHWNIKGKYFFTLHEKFEEIYNEVAEQIDEVAERILILEGEPLHAYSDFIEMAKISEIKNISTDTQAVDLTIKNLSVLLDIERQIVDHTSELSDETSTALMGAMIESQEKHIWMLGAFLSE